MSLHPLDQNDDEVPLFIFPRWRKHRWQSKTFIYFVDNLSADITVHSDLTLKYTSYIDLFLFFLSCLLNMCHVHHGDEMNDDRRLTQRGLIHLFCVPAGCGGRTGRRLLKVTFFFFFLSLPRAWREARCSTELLVSLKAGDEMLAVRKLTWAMSAEALWNSWWGQLSLKKMKEQPTAGAVSRWTCRELSASRVFRRLLEIAFKTDIVRATD